MELNKLLVLTDFTKASTVALEHSFQLAGMNQADITGLHLVSDVDDLSWAVSKTEKQAAEAQNYNPNITFRALATQSDLFADIGSLSRSQEAKLIYMATHGKKDIQFLTGSDALRVIRSAGTPMMIVQRETPVKRYERILLPLLDRSFERSELEPLVEIARLNKSEVMVLHPTYRENSDPERRLKRNLVELQKLFGSSLHGYSVLSTGTPPNKFANAVFESADDKWADLIALWVGMDISATMDSRQKSLVQKVITNKRQLPVMCF